MSVREEVAALVKEINACWFEGRYEDLRRGSRRPSERSVPETSREV